MARLNLARDDDLRERGLIRLAEAAAILGVHPRTVRRWIVGGRLAQRDYAGNVYVERAAVDALLPARVARPAAG